MRSCWILIGLIAAGASIARADEAEISLRPVAELRWGAIAEPGNVKRDALSYGGGLLAGYGLSFDWTLTARWGYGATADQQRASVVSPGDTDQWRQIRQHLLLGAAFTHGDELTPIWTAELGVAYRGLVDRRLLRGGRVVRAEQDLYGSFPIARLGALFEWRFLDFWSVAPGAYVAYDGDGLSFAGQLQLAAYHYL